MSSKKKIFIVNIFPGCCVAPCESDELVSEEESQVQIHAFRTYGF